MSKSKKTTENEAINEKDILKFADFVMQDTQNGDRVMNVLHIVAQDIYEFLHRISIVGGKEREKLEKEVGEIVSKLGEPKTTDIEEGLMNRKKDAALRQLFIYELMRQYTNQLKAVRNDNSGNDQSN